MAGCRAWSRLRWRKYLGPSHIGTPMSDHGLDNQPLKLQIYLLYYPIYPTKYDKQPAKQKWRFLKQGPPPVLLNMFILHYIYGCTYTVLQVDANSETPKRGTPNCWKSIYTYIYIYILRYTHKCIHIYVCAYIYTYIHICNQVSIYTRIYIYVYTYINIYIYTHTHMSLCLNS